MKYILKIKSVSKIKRCALAINCVLEKKGSVDPLAEFKYYFDGTSIYSCEWQALDSDWEDDNEDLLYYISGPEEKFLFLTSLFCFGFVELEHGGELSEPKIFVNLNMFDKHIRVHLN